MTLSLGFIRYMHPLSRGRAPQFFFSFFPSSLIWETTIAALGQSAEQGKAYRAHKRLKAFHAGPSTHMKRKRGNSGSLWLSDKRTTPTHITLISNSLVCGVDRNRISHLRIKVSKYQRVLEIMGKRAPRLLVPISVLSRQRFPSSRSNKHCRLFRMIWVLIMITVNFGSVRMQDSCDYRLDRSCL